MNKKILITYTNHLCYSSNRYLIASAERFNDFDEHITFHPWDLDEEFRKKNFDILKQPRGDGYWLWKPYIIKKTLDRMDEGDILFYIDTCTYFIRSMQPLLKLFSDSSLPVMAFNTETVHQEKTFTKRDVFIEMGLDQPEYYDTHQRCASFILWRKNQLSDKIANEWLSYSQNPHLIKDTPSVAINYEGFEEHRHDQSIFSLVTKKYNLPMFRDMSQLGNRYMDEYSNSPYQQLVVHHRHKTKIASLQQYLENGNPFMQKCYKFYKQEYGI